MKYDAFLKNLNQRGVFRIRPGLYRIRRVLKMLGHPQDAVPTIHIAGTNGKGSVGAALESVLRASGYRTGFYSSPHLIDLLERIQVQGGPTKIAFLKAAEEVLRAERKTRTRLTYFELMTAIAFRVFAAEEVDIAIVECGMGGKWDATNVIKKPLLSIITTIGADHKHFLGHKLTDIAYQKAGIIKRGCPVISGVQQAGRQVIAREARQAGSPLIQIDRDFFVSSLPAISHIPFQTIRYRSKESPTEAVPFALLGKHQAINAGIALTAIGELVKRGWTISRETRNAGMRSVVWAGRFQLIPRPRSGFILLDGAHNPHAMRSLLQTLQASNLRDTLKTFIFSCFKDKDYDAMAQQISRVADEVCLCPLDSPRAASLSDLRAAFKVDGPVRTFSSYEKALGAALQDTPADGLIIVTGSLMLVGQALQKLQMLPYLRTSRV